MPEGLNGLRSPPDTICPIARVTPGGERTMAQVNTMRGPIDGAFLGATLMHEHIFVLSPDIEKTSEEWDEEAQRANAVAKLRELKQRGIDTLVDLTVIGLGRYIPRIKAITDLVPDINVVV